MFRNIRVVALVITFYTFTICIVVVVYLTNKRLSKSVDHGYREGKQ